MSAGLAWQKFSAKVGINFYTCNVLRKFRDKTQLSQRIVKDFKVYMVAHCQKRQEKSRHCCRLFPYYTIQLFQMCILFRHPQFIAIKVNLVKIARLAKVSKFVTNIGMTVCAIGPFEGI